MNPKTIAHLLLCILLLPMVSPAQTLTCNDLKNGVFIFFSTSDGVGRTYTRNGEMQKEFNPTTHETVIWDVAWTSDCIYTLKYNSGMEDQPKQTLEQLKKHVFVCQILSVTNDYYVFQSSLDKPTNPPILKDTLWIKQRSDAKRRVTNNPRIDSLMAVRKAAYDSVVSKSAFLYVFRPGKFAESLQNYTLTLNDEPVCEMANKATYIIRLSKPGQTTFVAKVRKQETSITFNIQAGKKYYLRCELPWSLAPKPKLTEVNREEAETYFGNIK